MSEGSPAGEDDRGEAAALMRAGMALQAAGKFDAARQRLEAAVRSAPDEPGAWAALAGCWFAARQPEISLRVCANGLKRLGPNPTLLCAEARALQSMSRIAEAGARLRAALRLDPASAEARLGLALQALEAGDWREAEALAPAGEGPEWTWVRARAALLRGDLETARRLAGETAESPNLSPDQRAEALLLLAEALDGLDEPRAAFRAVAAAKGALRAYYAEGAAAGKAEPDRLYRLAAWFHATDANAWAEAPPEEEDAGVAGHAFLLGFPRSGTTLLEQALAGSPDLVALEEAPTLAEAAAALLGSAEGLARLARLSADEAARWRSRYWAEVRRHGVEPGGRVFLDKAPAGTLYLPLIAKLFPRARILFALRDPRDVALSCYRASFQMNAMTYAFTDLSETARCYDACMTMAQGFRAVLPLSLMEVRHERLVDAFEPELRRIASFVGLALTPAMLDVAATASRRPVRTPSAAQVRAGLSRRGIGRWRAYADELAPVMPTLAPWVEAYGYEPS